MSQRLWHRFCLIPIPLPTVEVNRWGHVVQANGPMAQGNAAVAYGSKALDDWGKQLSHFLQAGAIDGVGLQVSQRS
jgi:hypothetical protein